MSSQPSSLLVLIGAFNKPLNVGNTALGVTNPDGTTNISGTVIGVVQTAHSIADFATLGRGKKYGVRATH